MMPAEQLRLLAIEASTSTAKTALLYYPEHFTRPFCQLHVPIFRILDDPTIDRGAVAAPRGFGKTTVITLAGLSRYALYGLVKYILLVSNTLEQACDQLDTFKSEVEVNEVILAVFGELKGRIWREDKVELANGVFIRARGMRQQLRGLKRGRHRPGLIICDDLEDSEMVKVPEQRKKAKEWFYGDLMRCGINTGKDTKVALLGTVLHQDSLLTGLLESDYWDTVRLEAFDDDLKPTYPEYLNQDDVNNLYDFYYKEGQLDVLYMEYRNLPTAPENKPFKTFRRYQKDDSTYRYIEELLRRQELNIQESDDVGVVAFVICDPAKTSTPSADYSALLGVVVDPFAGAIYFHRFIRERFEPDQCIRAAFRLADALKTPLIYIEETGLNNWLLTVVRTVMIQERKIYDVHTVNATKKKEDRIIKLAPLYNIGMIHHLEGELDVLEMELSAFPKSRYDDASDCAAYVIPILNEMTGMDMTNLKAYAEAQRDAEKPWKKEDLTKIDQEECNCI